MRKPVAAARSSAGYTKPRRSPANDAPVDNPRAWRSRDSRRHHRTSRSGRRIRRPDLAAECGSSSDGRWLRVARSRRRAAARRSARTFSAAVRSQMSCGSGYREVDEQSRQSAFRAEQGAAMRASDERRVVDPIFAIDVRGNGSGLASARIFRVKRSEHRQAGHDPSGQ